MLIKADAAQLEWRTKVFLAQDPIGMKEIQEGYPIHDDNQKVFGLPTRTIAKVFLYRAIFADAFGEQGYKGPAFAYANDSDFMAASTSPKFWEEVMERFFRKYSGVREHSVGLIKQAVESGRIESPSGRFYLYSPVTKWNGSSDWPRTQILNHIVQGLAADFVMIARLLIHSRLKQLDEYHQGLVLPQNTVHDSVELDCENNPELIYTVCCLLEECFVGIPKRFEKDYGVVVNVPMAAETKFGMTLDENKMVKFKKETFFKDYENYLTTL